MLRPRSIVRHPKSPRRPAGKELDLLILAGCSCLMTILYHPVAGTLQSATATQGRASGAIAAQVSRNTPVMPIHTTLPPKRETLRQEDEEEA